MQHLPLKKETSFRSPDHGRKLNRADPGKWAESHMKIRIRKLPSLPEQIHPNPTNFLICRFEPGGKSSVRPSAATAEAMLSSPDGAPQAVDGGGEIEGFEERTRSTHQRPGRGGSGRAEPLEERDETPVRVERPRSPESTSGGSRRRRRSRCGCGSS
jgi:hypothetical protein